MITATITALRATAQKQASGANQSSGAVNARRSALRALRKALRNVNRTGRVLDRVHSGIAETFTLPDSSGYARLLVAAEAIHAKATELETDFVASGLEATFLTELTDLIAAFRAATSQKQDGGALRSGSTADLKAKTKAGLDAAIELDAYVRNHFRNDPEALGAWEFPATSNAARFACLIQPIHRRPARVAAAAPEPHLTLAKKIRDALAETAVAPKGAAAVLFSARNRREDAPTCHSE